VVDVADEAAEVEMAIGDMGEEWHHAKEKIDEKIVKKAEEEGVTKTTFFEFQEFDLTYMYAAEGGKLCWTCKKGLKCSKHGLERHQ